MDNTLLKSLIFLAWVSFWTSYYYNSKLAVSTGNFILNPQNFQDWWIEDQGLRMDNGGCRGDMEDLRFGVHISKLHCPLIFRKRMKNFLKYLWLTSFHSKKNIGLWKLSKNFFLKFVVFTTVDAFWCCFCLYQCVPNPNLHWPFHLVKF